MESRQLNNTNLPSYSPQYVFKPGSKITAERLNSQRAGFFYTPELDVRVPQIVAGTEFVLHTGGAYLCSSFRAVHSKVVRLDSTSVLVKTPETLRDGKEAEEIVYGYNDSGVMCMFRCRLVPAAAENYLAVSLAVRMISTGTYQYVIEHSPEFITKQVWCRATYNSNLQYMSVSSGELYDANLPFNRRKTFLDCVNNIPAGVNVSGEFTEMATEINYNWVSGVSKRAGYFTGIMFQFYSVRNVLRANDWVNNIRRDWGLEMNIVEYAENDIPK
ncbi:MAG: hypothetical protein FWE67_14525 [Planctomycetaceae bacterium]|nr:hypothetical protein [Planctomycetaceae bacterium]